MTPRSKSALIIFSTLLIGMVLGFLLNNLVPDKRRPTMDLMRRQERFHRIMDEIIKPSQEQREQLDQLLERRYRQIASIHEQNQEQIFAVFDSLQKDVASILTEEQQQNLNQELARGQERLFRGRVARLTEELNLSDEQRARIEEIMARMDAEFQGRPPLGFEGRRREHRDSLWNLFKKLHDEVEAVLTPEQRQKYRSMQRMRRFPRDPHPPLRSPLDEKDSAPAEQP